VPSVSGHGDQFDGQSVLVVVMLPDEVIDPSIEMSPAVVLGDKYNASPL
jgi:hypothetical protein